MKFTRKAVITSVIGTVAAVGVGGAVAAILLSTDIGGQASVREVATKNEITVTASAANGSKLDCSDIAVTSDFTSLTFNPKLTKPVGGGNASNVPVAGGECTVNLAVKNSGDTTIRVDGSSNISKFPAGWTVSNFSGNALSPIAPGGTGILSLKLTATQAAVPGAIEGKLVYTDAA